MISRYQTEQMKEIWSVQNKYQTWLNVEILASEAFNKLGKVPSEDLEKIQKNAFFSQKRIEEIEAETRHDVVAFTRCVSESLGEEKKWIHYGLTSTDVVDTANGSLFFQANKLIDKALKDITQTIKDKAIEHKKTVMMGRTHGVHAELTTFGFKMALYYDEMLRNIERFKLAKKQIEVGKISGAVGTYANVDPFVQDYVCEKLNLDSSKISTQTLQRDRHAFYISTIAIIGDTLDKIGTEFRHLQRTEIREVEEGFGKNQKGSSAMPHKKNPISSENICGLSRVLRGFATTAHENVALWHERDISHSSAERIIFEDATSLIEYMLKRMNGIIANLGVNKENMLKNINVTNKVFFSQRILLSLIDKGLSREKAYDIVQKVAIEAFNENKDFQKLISKSVENYLTSDEFEECFRTDYHLEKIDFVFQKLELQ